MKKNEWNYLAKAMWSYADKHEGKISGLLKELVVLVNHQFFTKGITEVNINDMGKYEQYATSDRPNDTNSTGSEDNN
jgi:hypothetical protein